MFALIEPKVKVQILESKVCILNMYLHINVLAMSLCWSLIPLAVSSLW